MYLPERSISLKPEDNGEPIPSPADSLYHRPSRDSRDSRLERNPRSSRKKREGVHCSMIKFLLLLLSKVRDSFASLEYLLYYAILSACLK